MKGKHIQVYRRLPHQCRYHGGIAATARLASGERDRDRADSSSARRLRTALPLGQRALHYGLRKGPSSCKATLQRRPERLVAWRRGHACAFSDHLGRLICAIRRLNVASVTWSGYAAGAGEAVLWYSGQTDGHHGVLVCPGRAVNRTRPCVWTQ